MNKYKVLLVDEEETCCMLKKIMERDNYEINAAQNPIDALEKVKNEKYHIVLVDIDRPEMDGIELLKRIKEYDALTQVIMTARHSTMEKVLGSLEYGANDYIHKPFKSEEEIKKVIDCSVQKLERWREAIIQLVNN